MTVTLQETSPGDHAAHILVVDDDARIRTLLARYLGREGFRVSMAADAADARTNLSHFAFDLAVFDVMMPGESGLALLAWLRRQNSCAAMPVLMLTARAEASDRIGGFEAGADDYLAKPFEPRELLLRIQSILRRTPIVVAEAEQRTAVAVRFGPFVFHIGRAELQNEGTTVRLTEREREILGVLASARGLAVSRAALAGPSGASERAVDVQVARLRRKLEPDVFAPIYLLTARGVGYQLVADPMAAP